jgi:hypothetical protein
MLPIPAIDNHEAYLPAGLPSLDDHQTALPAIAKDERLIAAIEEAVQGIPTHHELIRADARTMDLLTTKQDGIKGKFSSPTTELSFRNFAAGLSAHAIAYAKTR